MNCINIQAFKLIHIGAFLRFSSFFLPLFSAMTRSGLRDTSSPSCYFF